MQSLQLKVGLTVSCDLERFNQSGNAGTVDMGDARQVNAHCPRMWRVQKGDKLVAHCWRGIDINSALQRRQSAMFAGNNVDFRLIHALAVVIEQRESAPPWQNVPNSHDGQLPRSTRKCCWQEHGHYRPGIIIRNSNTCEGEWTLIGTMQTLSGQSCPNTGRCGQSVLGS